MNDEIEKLKSELIEIRIKHNEECANLYRLIGQIGKGMFIVTGYVLWTSLMWVL